MERHTRRPWLALVVVAVVGASLAILMASAAGHANASTHAVTPMVSIGHDWAVEGAVDSDNAGRGASGLPETVDAERGRILLRAGPDPYRVRLPVAAEPGHRRDRPHDRHHRRVRQLDADGGHEPVQRLHGSTGDEPERDLSRTGRRCRPIRTTRSAGRRRRRSTSRGRTPSRPARRSTSSSRSRTTTPTSSARRSTSPITISATPSRRASARRSSAWDRICSRSSTRCSHGSRMRASRCSRPRVTRARRFRAATGRRT